MLGWIKLCCDCDQYSGHVSTVLSHRQLVVINVQRANTGVCFYLFPSLSNYGELLKEEFLIFFSKMLKIPLHLNMVVVISTHKIHGGRSSESSCTSLKTNVDSMLLRAYLHIYFQSINAAFKT